MTGKYCSINVHLILLLYLHRKNNCAREEIKNLRFILMIYLTEIFSNTDLKIFSSG